MTIRALFCGKARFFGADIPMHIQSDHDFICVDCFAHVKSANTSLRICLTNNLFVRADTKKDAKKSLYFAYLVPLSIPCGTRLRGTSLHDITPLGFCSFLHPRTDHADDSDIPWHRAVLGGGGWGVHQKPKISDS